MTQTWWLWGTEQNLGKKWQYDFSTVWTHGRLALISPEAVSKQRNALGPFWRTVGIMGRLYSSSPTNYLFKLP
jgi:hypothetical protein